MSRRKIFVGDEYLDPISSKEMGGFLAVDATDKIAWVEDVVECNTFSLYLRANAKRWFHREGLNAAVGTIWVYSYKNLPAHSFNFYLTPNMRFQYIEPATDGILFRDERKAMLAII